MLRAYVKPKHYLPILFSFGLALFFLYDSTLRVLPSVVGTGVDEAYHLSSVTYGLLCASFYLLYVPAQLLIGLIVDRYNFPYLIAYSVLVCASGCYFFANASNFWLAELGRVLMGLGAACIFVSLLKTISLRFSKERFTFYFSLMVCITMLGSLLVHAILSLTEVYWGWRLTCYLLAFFGLVLVAFNLIDFKVVDAKRLGANRKSFTQELKELGAILCNRALWVQCIIGALLYLPIVGFAESWGFYYLKHLGQFSHFVAALDTSMIFLGFAVGAPLVGWIYTKTRQYQLLLTCGAVGVTTLLSIVIYVPEISALHMGLFLFLLGVFSSTSTIILSLNRQLATKQNAGKVFAVTNFVMMLAGFSALGIGSFLYHIEQSTLKEILLTYSVSTYQLAFLLLPLGSLLAVFLTFFVKEN